MPELELRHVGIGDAEVLYLWYADPQTRANSLNPEVVNEHAHRNWLQQSLAAPWVRGYMLEADGVAVAVVWYTRAHGYWEVAVTVAPGARGKGYGREILRQSANLVPGRRLRALVFADNEASLRAFQAAGYTVKGRVGLVLEREVEHAP